MAAVAAMASLSLVSTSSQGAPFQEFNGLAASTSFRLTWVPASRPAAATRGPLRIEAREPTRRETVKTRHRRLRKKLNGTTERPRLAVFRSNQHLYAQVIDDTKQRTLAHASTLSKEIREALEITAGPTIDVRDPILRAKGNIVNSFRKATEGIAVFKDAAVRVGEAIGKACIEKGISKVSFDRGGFVYHGRIKALADAAREAGLDF